MRSRYISLNSQYYCDDEETVDLREQQDAWAHEAFREATLYKAKHVVVLSHVPPFIADEDEQAGWGNWKWQHRRALLDAATAAGAKLWLSGHYHGNSVADSRGGIEVVVTSSCGGVINWTLDASLIATQPFPDFSKVVGSPPVVADARHSGLRLVRVTERGFTHRWFELADVPRSLDDAFSSRPGWSTVKNRYWGLADVMGLSASDSRRPSRPSDLEIQSRPPRSKSLGHIASEGENEDRAVVQTTAAAEGCTPDDGGGRGGRKTVLATVAMADVARTAHGAARAAVR